MNQKALTKTVLMISKGKNPLVSMVYTQILQRVKGLLRVTSTFLFFNRTPSPLCFKILDPPLCSGKQQSLVTGKLTLTVLK